MVAIQRKPSIDIEGTSKLSDLNEVDNNISTVVINNDQSNKNTNKATSYCYYLQR